MRVLTNLFALYAVLLVLVSLVAGIALYPIDSAAKALIFSGMVLGAWLLGTIVTGRIQVAIQKSNGESGWLQPVSKKAGTLVINTVVVIWLCVVGLLIVFMSLKESASMKALLWTIALVTGVGLGSYIRKRFSGDSLLPYGISFTGALMLTIVVFLITRLASQQI